MKRRLWATALGAVMVVMMLSAASPANDTSFGVATPYLSAKRTHKLAQKVVEYIAYIEQQQLVAYLNAVTVQQVMDYLVARSAADLQAYLATLPRINVDVGHWSAINMCEESGTWVNDGWTSDGHFQGGLGMSVDAWNSVIGEAASYGVYLPPSSNQATPYEQMEGAQILYNRLGPSPWVCKA